MSLGGGWGSWPPSGAAASLRTIWGCRTLPHPGRPESLVENLSDPKTADSSRTPASACQDSARVMRNHLVTEFRYKPISAQPVNPGLWNSCGTPNGIDWQKRRLQLPLRSSFPGCPPSLLCAESGLLTVHSLTCYLIGSAQGQSPSTWSMEKLPFPMDSGPHPAF